MSLNALKPRNRDQVANAFLEVTPLHAAACLFCRLETFSIFQCYHINLG